MNPEGKQNWFENNPRKTQAVILLVLLALVDGGMHLLYWAGLLPYNMIYMTRLEKGAYRPNINKLVYEDNVPRHASGFATYAAKGIPPQYIEFDEHGMRIDAFDGTGSDALVVGVFGDSYTDALQVGQDEVFTSVAESSLRERGCHIDIRNFGLGATGTSAQYLRYKQLEESGLHFDYVILTMFLGNDILNNNKELDMLFPRRYTAYPYFTVENSVLVRDDNVRGTQEQYWFRFKELLLDYSHLANTVFNLKTIYQAYKKTRVEEDIRGEPNISRTYKLTDRIYREPVDEKWITAWDITERIIRLWNNETSKHNEKLVLVFLTQTEQLDNNYTNAVKLDLDYPNRRMARFAEAEGIEYIDFLPYARARISEKSVSYPYLSWEHDGHYNQIGHKFLSELLVQFFRTRANCAPVEVSWQHQLEHQAPEQ